MSSFLILFKEITGYHPFPWQEELFNQFVENKIPCLRWYTNRTWEN